MKPIYIFIVIMIIFSRQFCIAGNKNKVKTTKELIHNNLMEAGNSEEEIFALIFRMLIDEKGSSYTLNSGELIIGKRGPELTEKEYSVLFNERLDQNTTNQYQYKMKQALVDSVCAFHGIDRNELVKIIKDTHTIGNRKKEIKKLFLENRKLMEDKFNREKVVNSVLKELIPTVQTYPQEEQLAPSLPEQLI